MDYEIAWTELVLKIVNGSMELEKLRNQAQKKVFIDVEASDEFLRLKYKRQGIELVAGWMKEILETQ